jgi:hypothetical protein
MSFYGPRFINLKVCTPTGSEPRRQGGNQSGREGSGNHNPIYCLNWLKSIRIINANASRSTAQRGLTFLSRLSEGFPSLPKDHRQHQEGAAQTGLCLAAGFTYEG